MNFEPRDEDIFITISKGRQRLIFSPPQVLDDKEENYLREFREHMRAKNLEIPPGYDDNTRLVLRFLQGTGFSYEKAEQAIIANYAWKKEAFPMDPTPFMDFLN